MTITPETIPAATGMNASRADFPVHWPKPSDAKLFWQFRPIHYPQQIKPLAEPFCRGAFEDGNEVTAQYGAPVRLRTMVVNSYYYMAFAPPDFASNGAAGAPLPSLAEIERQYMNKLRPALTQLRQLWNETWLPEIQAYITACEAFDLANVTLADLVTQFAFVRQGQKRMGELLAHIMLPVGAGMLLFTDLYTELFPDDDKFAAFILLQGEMNKSIEGSHALWQLSRQALAWPAVQQLFATCTDAELLTQLSLHEEGRQFLKALDAFLFEYGKRGDSVDVFGNPSWLEDPTPVFKNIRDYMNQPDLDLPAEYQSFLDEVQKTLARARFRLQGYPQAVREQFEQSLATARTAMLLKENHNYWIDQRASWQVRAILLEFGQRFAAAGLIAEPLDVMYLRIEELDESAAHFPTLDRHALVAARKAEFAQFAKLKPPPVLGTIPTTPPPNDLITRGFLSASGRNQPPAPITENTLRGLGGSAGKARGLAKVVLSLAAAGKLQKGDILVTQTTIPPWTPLFATAAAVVTETGGILSHCAVSAREFRIPAVLGITGATQRIEDGMLLEVDGDAGIVQNC